MAFQSKDLSVLAYANGFTLWHYRSAADALSAIAGAGYFDAASDMLRVGDTVIAQDSGDDIAVLRVASNAGGVVGTDLTPPRSAAIADTTGLAVAALETEVNKVKAALRAARIIAP